MHIGSSALLITDTFHSFFHLYCQLSGLLVCGKDNIFLLERSLEYLTCSGIESVDVSAGALVDAVYRARLIKPAFVLSNEAALCIQVNCSSGWRPSYYMQGYHGREVCPDRRQPNVCFIKPLWRSMRHKSGLKNCFRWDGVRETRGINKWLIDSRVSVAEDTSKAPCISTTAKDIGNMT